MDSRSRQTGPNPTRPNLTRPNPTRPIPVRPNPSRPDPTRLNPVRPDPSRPNPIRPNPIRPDHTRPNPTRPNPARPRGPCSKCKKHQNLVTWCSVCEASGLPIVPWYCCHNCREADWDRHEEQCRYDSDKRWGRPFLTWEALCCMKGKVANGWYFEFQILELPKDSSLPQVDCRDCAGEIFVTSFMLFNERKRFEPLIRNRAVMTWKDPYLDSRTTSLMVLDRNISEIAIARQWQGPVARDRLRTGETYEFFWKYKKRAQSSFM